MLKSEVGLLIAVATFFVGVFIALQLMAWRGGGRVVGGSRRFAQFALVIGSASMVAGLLVLLAPTLDLGFLRGAPFVVLYTMALLGVFIVPALATIEVILVAQCVLTQRVDRGARLWHLAACLVCTAWVAVVLVAVQETQ